MLYMLASQTTIAGKTMDNSIYVALSRELALFRDMDATANNVANANTTGYDADHILFGSYVTKDINEGNKSAMSFDNDIKTYRNTETGSMQVTGNDLDVAIQGNGYFVVQTPLGLRYTRAGNFSIGPDGSMMTAEGYRVMDNANQPIVFDDSTRTIQIGEAGNVKVNGEDFANLNIAQFDNPQLLERLNARLFKSDVPPQPAQDFRVLQGTLESSNVQPVLELTHMVNVSRSLDSTAQFIAAIYDLERKAADAWAQQS